MKSDPVLLKNLRKISPMMNELIKAALEEKNFILSFDEFLKVIPENLPRSRHNALAGHLMGKTAGCCIGHNSERIIVVRWPEFEKISQWPELQFLGGVRDSDKGIAELCFAYLVGSNRSLTRPSCAKIFIEPAISLRCEYSAALSWFDGLKIIAAVAEKVPDMKIFKGKPSSYHDILRAFGVPGNQVKWSLKCPAVGLHQWKRCPKEGEIKKIAKAIKTLFL